MAKSLLLLLSIVLLKVRRLARQMVANAIFPHGVQ
jgi:hypothetical protein